MQLSICQLVPMAETSLHQPKILSRHWRTLFSLPLQCFWLQAVPKGVLELAVSAWFPTEIILRLSIMPFVFAHPSPTAQEPIDKFHPNLTEGSGRQWSDLVCDRKSLFYQVHRRNAHRKLLSELSVCQKPENRIQSLPKHPPRAEPSGRTHTSQDARGLPEKMEPWRVFLKLAVQTCCLWICIEAAGQRKTEWRG